MVNLFPENLKEGDQVTVKLWGDSFLQWERTGTVSKETFLTATNWGWDWKTIWVLKFKNEEYMTFDCDEE